MARLSDRIPWSRLFAEGAIIVVSVLLALAADAWLGERQARDAARTELATVLDELSDKREQLLQIGSYNGRALDGLHVLRLELEGVPTGAPVSVSDSLASQLVWIAVTDDASPILDSFLQQDHLRQVRDPELRQLLLQWPPRVEDLRDDEERTADQIDQEFVPYLSAEFDFARPLDLVFTMWTPAPDLSGIGVTRLRSSERLRNIVSRQISMLRLVTSQNQTALQHLDRLVQLIEDELD